MVDFVLKILRKCMTKISNKKNFVPKDAQCSETNEKTDFSFSRFLVFEIWLILLKILRKLTKMSP